MNPLPHKLQAEQGPVWIYNPLPEALHHYEEALFDVLSAAGIKARSAEAPSVEVLGASKWGRAKAAMGWARSHSSRVISNLPTASE